MNTNLSPINPVSPEAETISRAVALLRKGSVIVFPTETVYGLGADAFSPEGIEAIFEIKERARDKPLQVLVSSLEMAESLAEEISPAARALLKKFWPGPLTAVFRAKPGISPQITSGTGTVGVRFPLHAVPVAIIQALGSPLAATSANVSGEKAPRSLSEIPEEITGKVSLILDGGTSAVGKESTVVDCTGKQIRVLRGGAISTEEIAQFLG